jgi:autotransporter-associated beta strand protein
MAGPLRATDYYWDANGAAAGTGGTGTWGTANTWRDASATGSLLNWVDGNAAFFGGTAGTTTVGANVAVSGITMSIAGHTIVGTGKIDFGAGGTVSLPTTANKITAPLAGNVTFTPTTGTLSTSTTVFLKANSPDLVSSTLSGNDPNRNIILDHVGAFGPTGASVTITNSILGLGALTSETIGATTGSGGGLNFNTWNSLTMAGAIRSRVGTNTINSPTTLTGNSTLLCRGATGAKLTFAHTATIALGGNTLLLVPAALSTGIELNGVISGSGGVTQADTTLTGAGTLNAASVSTLAATNTYTGPTTINKGTLNLTGSLTSNVAIANGANLSGEGSTTGSVTFAGTSTVSFSPATSAALTAASVDASAATITLTSVGVLGAGIGIVVIDAPGGITGTLGTNFIYTGSGTMYFNGDKTKLLLDFAPRSVTWRGNDLTNPTFWDLNTTTNWLLGAAPDKFFTTDLITFDDDASSFIVTAQGTDVQPGAITISNNTSGHDYLFNGAPIAGTTNLTKQGSQKATLASNNTYTGGTTISAGTLQLGDGTVTGAAGSGAIVDNAALIISSGSNNQTIPNSISGTGTLTYSGTGVLSLGGNITITGATTIDSGNLQIGAGAASGSITGNIVNNSTLSFNRTDPMTVPGVISGTGNLSKTLGGAVTLSGANTFGGTVTISGANQVLVAASNTALGTTLSGTVVTSAGRLDLANGVIITGETVDLSGASTSFNGALQAQAGASATWDGPIRSNSLDVRIGTGVGGTLTITGPMQDGTATAINFGSGVGGTGTVIVATPAGGNTYTGPTSLIRGTVKLGAANTLPATTILDVDASTAVEACVFDLNGFSQTLAGLKRGNATGGASTLTNSSSTAATLTVNQSSTSVYSGALTGNFALIKDGAGTLNTTGAISYSGNTTVLAGTLSFSQVGLSDTSTVSIASGAVAALNFTGNDRVGALIINGETLPDGVYSSTSHGGIYASYLTGPGALQVGEIGYVPWIAGFPTLTGNDALPTADPDGDGVVNLLEFVLGGSPIVSDASILPSMTTSPNGLNLILSCKRTDLSQVDTTLVLQVGTDLATWPPSAEITLGPISDTSGTLPGEITYAVQENADLPDDIVITIPNSVELRKFLRFKATKP